MSTYLGGTLKASARDAAAAYERRIIFVNRFFYPDLSATSQILTELAFDLAQEGLDVSVVTSRLRYDDAQARLPAFEIVGGVKVHRAWSTGFGRANLALRAVDYVSFYLGSACAMWRLARRNSVIVAETDPPLVSLCAAVVARCRGAMLVNWLQDLFPEVARTLGMRVVGGPVLWLLTKARDASLRSAAINVVLGSRMEAVVRGLGVPGSHVRVIHNWADGEDIQPQPAKTNQLRSEWGLSGKFVVGYSGNLGRAHEFATILEAAELLRDRSHIAFLFVGAGAQRSTVEAEVTRRGLWNVFFRPYQPRARLSESLGVADAHLVSLNPELEGLIVPSKFYGIAAAGRPTLFVGDPAGEIARIVSAEGCGHVARSGDAESLARQIVALASVPDVAATMGRRARALFEREFDRKLAVRAWKEVLR